MSPGAFEILNRRRCHLIQRKFSSRGLTSAQESEFRWLQDFCGRWVEWCYAPSLLTDLEDQLAAFGIRAKRGYNRMDSGGD